MEFRNGKFNERLKGGEGGLFAFSRFERNGMGGPNVVEKKEGGAVVDAASVVVAEAEGAVGEGIKMGADTLLEFGEMRGVIAFEEPERVLDGLTEAREEQVDAEEGIEAVEA